MTNRVLYDAPGPKTLRTERIVSAIMFVALLAGLALLLKSGADRGIFDDRWRVLYDPPKSQTAVDVWKSLLVHGLGMTLKAALIAAPSAFVLAFIFAIARNSKNRIVSWVSVAIIEFLRGMPVLLMMFFGLLALRLDSFSAVVFGLTLYNAAIMAEILRAGLLALPRGQAEAGTAIGLTTWENLRIIQFPQVITLMLPSLISQFIVLLKDSSLGFIVGYNELLTTMKDNYSFFGDTSRLPLFIAVVSIYLIVSISLSRLAVWVEKKLANRHA
ncbi:amino acid ABC transporter permease [Timonella senegalensis]|uniref:amino acid ABC transporter permease n=1 Tax=Timonella senegalensis TaxID=1465825 RepID=UPI0002F2485E|nr:amino acid ABC transporter permease [Timonella senegalensis]